MLCFFSGQVPAVAEYRYLDKVKWLEMYGVDLHPVQVGITRSFLLNITCNGIYQSIYLSINQSIISINQPINQPNLEK